MSLSFCLEEEESSVSVYLSVCLSVYLDEEEEEEVRGAGGGGAGGGGLPDQGEGSPRGASYLRGGRAHF